MANQIHQLLLIILLLFYLQSCSSCGEDCPEDCDCEDKCLHQKTENSINKFSDKCVDRSELCHQMKKSCENVFFRKCMRCACPKTCGSNNLKIKIKKYF